MSIFASILRSVYKLSGAKKAFALPEEDWWIFEPNESVLFDNFNASRLRARNLGGALSILRIAK